MKLEVSTKHLKLRIVLFVVFFIVSVTAITLGVLGIGRKTSGYQTISADTDAEALLYSNGITFRYYLEGSSNEIKRQIKEIQTLYSRELSSAFKQLDCDNAYDNYVGIGAINQNLNQEITISPELYAILKDAYARTLLQSGFNMFAGALYAEWKSILILDDPENFDPAFNADESQRISDIAAMVSDLGNFGLEFLDDVKARIRLSVSEDYERFCRDYEIEAPVLDLNNLHDAYMLQMVGNGLERDGYSNGYLCTDEGTVLCLGTKGTLDYDLYTLDAGEEVKYATVSMDGRFCAVTMTAFGLGSDYHYEVQVDGKTYYRNLFFDCRTGEFTDVLMSLGVISQDNNLVENAYQAMVLSCLDSELGVNAYSKILEADKMVSYVFQSAK